jgi:dienelactone hydrolase
MGRLVTLACLCTVLAVGRAAAAEVAARVIDVPSRAGVTQRFLYVAPQAPVAALVVFAGGDGGLDIGPDGTIHALGGNFLVRSRDLFVESGLAVAIVDAPSDRRRPPHLNGFRQTNEHVADVKAVIAWLRQEAKVPVWLIGTSRGTQSAAFVATRLPPAAGGADGLILTSTIVTDPKGRPVPAMELSSIGVPVLVVHHEQDACALCAFDEVPRMMPKLAGAPRKELVTFRGGETRGDPCEAFAYHGFNGLEKAVVARVARWVRTH